MGEMLAATERASHPAGPGRGKVGDKALPTLSDVPTLSALGITKRESSQAQLLARLPQEKQAAIIAGELTPTARPASRKPPPERLPWAPSRGSCDEHRDDADAEAKVMKRQPDGEWSEQEFRRNAEEIERKLARLKEAVRHGTFYREFARFRAKGDDPLFLSKKDFEIAERFFVALDHERMTKGFPREVFQWVPPGNQHAPFDVPDKLRGLAWWIGYWQMMAVMSPRSDSNYEQAKAKLNKLRGRLRRITKSLVPPKPRGGKFAANIEGVVYTLALRRFFWTLLHGEFLSLKRASQGVGRHTSEAQVLRTLKGHYSYLSLPDDFDDRIQCSPYENARDDTASAAGVAPESIAPLLSRVRAHR